MGGTSSRVETREEAEQRELEREAASVGALPLLHSCWDRLTLSSSSHSLLIPLSSLEQCFSITSCCKDDCFPAILPRFGSAIAHTLFAPSSEVDKDTMINWVDFVRGYVSACGRMSASSLLTVLFRVLASASSVDLRFQDSSELNGSVSPRELGIILSFCWIIAAHSHQPQPLTHHLTLPDTTHLLLSALLFCVDNPPDVWDASSHLSCLDAPLLPVGKIHMWALRTVPNLAACCSTFISSRLNSLADAPPPQQPSGTEASSRGCESTSLAEASESYLLTGGRAWALSLSQRSSISEEILRICFPCSIDVIEDSLLYRSGAHGRGLNRFWSNIEGYHGPVLVLISATSGESSETSRKWIIGALTHQGFENRDVFYGGGGCLYSISPVFQAFSALGKEQNYVYSHLHPAVKAYDPHPKPVGIAFGGSTGNERIFIDEDFAKVIVQHHAVDKTYQHGPLFPNQGYLPVEASILDVEVWGFGGKAAKAVQMSYKKREELFTEQRRKVDLKTFASWEDSPEKMMMDMMGDPNAVRREDR